MDQSKKVIIRKTPTDQPQSVKWWVWGYVTQNAIRTGITTTLPSQPRPDKEHASTGLMHRNNKKKYTKGRKYSKLGPMAKLIAGPFTLESEAQEAQEKWISSQK